MLIMRLCVNYFVCIGYKTLLANRRSSYRLQDSIVYGKIKHQLRSLGFQIIADRIISKV